jgi:4'-phosphopantetheinyl transferase EntD
MFQPSLFPAPVATVIATPEMWTTPVLAREEALILQAHEKRKREFRAGRHCAHGALEQLGLPASPILRGEKREPLWPQGYQGSISHCRDFCLAACCKLEQIRGIGVDVEPLEPMKPGVQRHIESATESAFMRLHPDLPERLIFSLKESLYKCLFPHLGRYFGFHAVELQIDRDDQRYGFTPTADSIVRLPEGVVFHGRYELTDNHLLSGCYLTLA